MKRKGKNKNSTSKLLTEEMELDVPVAVVGAAAQIEVDHQYGKKVPLSPGLKAQVSRLSMTLT